MITMILNKIRKNKWLTACLVLGIVFLVAAVSCQPMFRMGSEDKLLLNLFHKYLEENNEYPFVVTHTHKYKEFENSNADSMIKTMQDYEDLWTRSFGPTVPVIASQRRIGFKEMIGRGQYADFSNDMTISYMPDMDEHIQLVKGEGYDASIEGSNDEKIYPCIISEQVLDQFKLVVGERLTFKYAINADGKVLKLYVSGVFKASDTNDVFWFRQPGDMRSELFVSNEVFHQIEKEYSLSEEHYEINTVFDFTKVNHNNAVAVYNSLGKLAIKEKEYEFFYNCKDSLKEFVAQKKAISVMIWVLELPVLGMAFAFLFMVSKQILDLEKNEISMLRSRGFSKSHVIYMYAVQFFILGMAGLFIGVFLGWALCLLASGTTNFLTFSFTNTGIYHFTFWMFVYGFFATLAGLLVVLIPVLLNTGASVVEQRADKYVVKKSFWEKYFIDILLLVISAYFLYTYYQSVDSIRDKALSGTRMDPGIFLDSTLLILAFGLFSLRILHYLVRLITYLGRNIWKPATYASLLQITRNFDKQGIISVFMIITIALGLFYANTARTINQNYIDRIEYSDGTDLVIREYWEKKCYWVRRKGEITPVMDFKYIEPDDKKYTSMDGNICKKFTKVLYDDVTIVGNDMETKEIPDCCLRGINTKEFGEIASLKDELNRDEHWFNYLNALAKEEKGVIISRNLATELNMQVGDTLTYKRMYPLIKRKNEVLAKTKGKIVAIVDAWPGFDQYYIEDGQQKEKYLIVANYGVVLNVFDKAPYEIWMKLGNGVSSMDVVRKLKDNGSVMDSYRCLEKGIDEMRKTPMIQITNGMFTQSFLISLILCMVGFMIYWISTIKQRELLFGVYRAMGMSIKEINKMLIVEHAFTTLLAIISGITVGTVSTLLFSKLIGIIYMPQKHNLGVYVYYEPMDMVKLAVTVACILTICLFVLRRIIKKMNISQALKLGED